MNGCVHVLPLSSHISPVQCHEGPDGGVVRCRNVPVSATRTDWRRTGQVVVTATMHNPTHSHRHQVRRLVVSIWPILSEPGQRRHHQRRVDSAQFIVTQPERIQASRVVAFQQNVGLLDQIPEHFGALLRGNVESDPLLRRVERPEMQTSLPIESVAAKRSYYSRPVPSRRLHLDDARPHLPEQLADKLPLLIAQVEYGDVREGRVG